MSNFKFGALCMVGLFFMYFPFPFAFAWGYKAIPIATVCYAVAFVITKKLLKEVRQNEKQGTN